MSSFSGMENDVTHGTCGPLQKLLVLDFSTLLPGPLASLMLAEAGARVIKVERPGGGDDMRLYQPRWGTDSAIFSLLNRGKESLVVDLKDEAARATLMPLIQAADVLIEGFRPGVMQRLGLGYDELARINPRIIYCSITAYGQFGTNRDKPAHDLNLMAESGLLALSVTNPIEAVMPPTPVADIAGGSYPALVNILLAIVERAQTDRGRHLDIALADNLFTLGYWALAHGWSHGDWPTERTHLENGASPRYRLYVSRDGKGIAAAALEEKFWHNFCDAVGLRPELRDDSRDPKATTQEISRLIAATDAAVWAERFAARECCCSVIEDLRTAVSKPHFEDRGLFRHRVLNSSGASMPALPVPLDPGFRASSPTQRAAPSLPNE
jgi:alpha-methylacyl-CoA racemase